MVKIYVALIKKGIKTIDDVPAQIRAEVAKLLDEVWVIGVPLPKVIKNSEYAEAGIDVEYEPTELNAERQILRDAINAAETELATLTGGVSDAG